MNKCTIKYQVKYYYYEILLEDFLKNKTLDYAYCFNFKAESFNSLKEAKAFFDKEINCEATIVTDEVGNKFINSYYIELTKFKYVIDDEDKNIKDFNFELIDANYGIFEDKDYFDKVIFRFLMEYYSALINKVVSWDKPNSASNLNKDLLSLRADPSHSSRFIDCLYDTFRYSKHIQAFEDIDLIHLLNTYDNECDAVAWEKWEYEYRIRTSNDLF